VNFSSEWREVVGVVGDATEIGAVRNGFVREKGLSRSTLPSLYLPTGAVSQLRYYLLVRTIADERDVIPTVRAEIHAADSEVAIYDTNTFEDRVGRTSAETRFYAVVLDLFAVVALALAGIGLFGVVVHNVARRRHEIGIRIALGASPGRVQKAIMGQVLGLVGIGSTIGLSVAVAAGASVRAFLFDVSPSDPLTFAATLAVLGVTTGLATYLPARRASRIDPMVALRCE